MIKRLSIASVVLTVLAAILASMLVVAVPAFAAPQGDGSKSESKQTERSDDADQGDHDGDADSDPETQTKESTNESDDTTSSDPDGNNHPSGKDRSVENTWDGDKNPNQGKAESNPDDTNGPGDRWEGAEGEDDKPNAGGGEDLADQDGNNGCGNDDDFDDDNNGWCGRPTDNDVDAQEVCDADKTMPGIQKCEKDDVCDKDNNMANGIQKCEDDEDVVLGDFEAKPLPDAPVVLGTRFASGLTRPAAPRAEIAPSVVRGGRIAGGVLPFTGGNPLSLILIALGILASGAVTMVATRK